MRTKVINEMTIEYPDEICFCFNPVVMNVIGFSGDAVEMVIVDNVSKSRNAERRALFGEFCFFDVSFYMQSFFDDKKNDVDYSMTGAQDSCLGRSFAVTLNFYSGEDQSEEFQFTMFCVWGAMKIGERYNGYREMRWFKNFPFSVGMYSAGVGTVSVVVDGVEREGIELTENKIWNIMMKGINAVRDVDFSLLASSVLISVFDKTFDFTFKGVSDENATVRLIVDDADEGVYLRWINRHGFYCYWLFDNGDEMRKVANDGEFIRNNMQDYSYANGYHGGTGRKQRKMEESTLPVCAPLVDSDTFDFLFQVALSPVVDMYEGKDGNGVDRWKGVNVSVGSYNKMRTVLQDFVATIILPETSVQSL